MNLHEKLVREAREEREDILGTDDIDLTPSQQFRFANDHPIEVQNGLLNVPLTDDQMRERWKPIREAIYGVPV